MIIIAMLHAISFHMLQIYACDHVTSFVDLGAHHAA